MSEDRRGKIDKWIEKALSYPTPVERMEMLYKVANHMYEEVPYELAKQIEIYAHILRCMGELQAAAKHDAGAAEADRKRIYGVTLYNSAGSTKDREGMAEEAAHAYRMHEAEANAEYDRWRQAFNSTQELIHAKKQTLNVLLNELNMRGAK